MPKTKSYQRLHEQVVSRPGAAERLDALREETLAEMQRRYDDHGAYLQAVRFLGPRNRSASEIRQHLIAKGWHAEAAHQAIERLKQEGYVDDRLFTKQWIDYRCRTAPRSRMAIMQELQQKGIASETILSAVATMDEAALALDCAQKKARQWRRICSDLLPFYFHPPPHRVGRMPGLTPPPQYNLQRRAAGEIHPSCRE